jgi:hypothetical protein
VLIETSSSLLREVERLQGRKENFFMLTEKRLVQCPHITVTTVDKLLHGTLTYNIREKTKNTK